MAGKLPERFMTNEHKQRLQEERRALAALKKARRIRSDQNKPAGAVMLFYGGDGALHIRVFSRLYED